jgi:hypothetical protein
MGRKVVINMNELNRQNHNNRCPDNCIVLNEIRNAIREHGGNPMTHLVIISNQHCICENGPTLSQVLRRRLPVEPICWEG